MPTVTVGCKKRCKMRAGSVTGVAFLLFLAVATAAAQQRTILPREAIDSLLNPPLHPKGEEILSFSKVKENIGTIYESDTARTVNFVFRNVSDRAVRITKVTTHCGCTAPAFEPGPIASGEASTVAVTYNPRGRSGTIDTSAFVYTDCSGATPVARLTILGNVVDLDEWSHLPCKAGALRFKRKFVTIDAGRKEVRVPCANVGDAPLRLSAQFVPAYATFATEPQVLQSGEEGDIIITIDAQKAKGYEGFSLLLDGVQGKISSRTIKVKIE